MQLLPQCRVQRICDDSAVLRKVERQHSLKIQRLDIINIRRFELPLPRGVNRSLTQQRMPAQNVGFRNFACLVDRDLHLHRTGGFGGFGQRRMR